MTTPPHSPTKSPTSPSFHLPDPDTPDSETPTLEQRSSGMSRSASSSSSTSSSSTSSPPLRRSMLHHSSSSLNFNFAPPFYNRPPTPLPPSPSLTSLLRPPFSTTTSRPSTPDSSDVDGGGETGAETESAITRGAKFSATVPRRSPKVPTYEYYGFVLYLMAGAGFLLYLLWSYLPAPFLKQLGLTYYPNRWWSLAIPSFLVMLIVYIYVALASYNTGYLTLPIDSIECIVDDASNIAVLDSKGRMVVRGSKSRGDAREPNLKEGGGVDWTKAWSEGTDAVMDIPIGGVCEVLYGDG